LYHKIDHRTAARRSITNYHRTIFGHKILNDTTIVTTMSFALCLRHVGSVVVCKIMLLSPCNTLKL
ncbi:unnamed protein product, partial [Musa acuminata subsp. burmannicoides]